MNVVFRVDASIQIGTGHVMRCLTMAEALAHKGYDCHFICRDLPGHFGEYISGKGYKLSLLPAPTASSSRLSASVSEDCCRWLGVSWHEDSRQTLGVLTMLKATWLVVDHYALDAKWERTLSNAVTRIMVIDDLANRPHQCALLLDQNLGRLAGHYDGLVPDECRRLVGSRFALLRPEFVAFRPKSLERRKNPKIRRILISLGGVDSTNATSEVLTAIGNSSLPENTVLDIVMGGSAPHLQHVRQQAAELPFKTTVDVNVPNMAERMYLADLSIGAVGSTSWERCCLGVPSILLVVADNQKSAADELRKSGAAVIVDGGEGVRAELDSLLHYDYATQKLQRMIHLSSAMVTGDGCSMVVNKLVEETDTL